MRRDVHKIIKLAATVSSYVFDIMLRQARIDAPGALHHIIIRGIERKRIFQNDLDRDDFLSRMGNILPESKMLCVGIASKSCTHSASNRACFYCHDHEAASYRIRNKSILCQEDPYLLELVRYTHLNPLRAKLVKDLKELERYPYSEHRILMGIEKSDWQDVDYVLGYFGSAFGVTRRRYSAYVGKGVETVRRPELTGGGLIRSVGGWTRAKELAGTGIRLKGDERILGDSDFVPDVLDASKGRFEGKYRLKSQGFTLSRLAKRVSELLTVDPECIYAPGKYPKNVKARKLGLAQPAVSISVKRGKAIADENDFQLLDG